MAQATQKVKGLCNTNRAPKKSRNWCFTLNNYSDDEVAHLTQCFSDSKFLFQEEEGENGTPHLQGVVSFKNARSFASMKKLIPRAHIEPCKSFIASVRYCSKEETRVGEIYSNFDYTSIGNKKKTEKKKAVIDQAWINQQIADLMEMTKNDTSYDPEYDAAIKRICNHSVIKGKMEQNVNP